MKGFILAAGLGTRLKPWTLSHPKALVPVAGVPMLERVVTRLNDAGIRDITVNVHHFHEQIRDFIKRKGWDINISDESDRLLDTGGALLKAGAFLHDMSSPVLIHNVDILSDADLNELEKYHTDYNADITLLVSDRLSSRKLIFNSFGKLKGWHSHASDEYRPENIVATGEDRELAFSGIYIVSTSVFDYMHANGWQGKFSIIDFLLAAVNELKIIGYHKENLALIDIGKPETLSRANTFFS